MKYDVTRTLTRLFRGDLFIKCISVKLRRYVLRTRSQFGYPFCFGNLRLHPPDNEYITKYYYYKLVLVFKFP